MSTRCQIGFYRVGNQDLHKPDVLLYRHCDGMPGKLDGSEYGILPDLVPFLKVFNKDRGLDDVEYAAAWASHHLIEIHIQDMKKLGKRIKDYLPKDGKDFVGHGICADFHGDIEYYYAVRNKKLEVYRVQSKWNDGPKFVKMRTVKL